MKKSSILMISMGLALSCSKSKESSSASTDSDDTSRFQMTEESIPIDTTDAGTQLVGILDDLLSLTPTLTLVGTLAPPTVTGNALQASDITVANNKVYVAHSLVGDTLTGAIDVINIADPLNATLSSQQLYTDVDIFKVAINGSFLYAVGSTAAGDGGAILKKIALDGSGNLTSTTSTVALRGAASATVSAYAGTSVVASGSKVYALSGNNGGLSILNANDLTLSSFTAIEEARDISMSSGGTSVYVVTGKTAGAEALVKQYNATTGVAESYTATLASAQVDGGKSTVFTGSTVQIATAGYGGAKLVCLTDGSTLATMANPALAGLTADLQVANAATFGNGLLYVANGGAGVSVYAVTRTLLTFGCNGLNVYYLGRFNFGDGASANNIYYSGGYLVVATGATGFKIVKVQQSLLLNLLLLL